MDWFLFIIGLFPIASLGFIMLGSIFFWLLSIFDDVEDFINFAIHLAILVLAGFSIMLCIHFASQLHLLHQP